MIPNDTVILTDEYLIQSSSEHIPPAVIGNLCRDPQTDFMWRENLNWRTLSNPSFLSQRIQWTRWWKYCKRKGDNRKNKTLSLA